MNRFFLAIALVLSSSTLGLVGCEQKSEEKTTTTKSTPSGEIKVDSTTTVEKKGDAKD